MASAPSPSAPRKEAEIGWASWLGGAALVGAAAGYAALALRFRNFGNNPDKFTTGGAEFRAAQAFSRDFMRSAEKADGASAEAGRERARRAYQEAAFDSGGSRGSSNNNGRCPGGDSAGGRRSSTAAARLPHQWALDELGLNSSPTTDEAKRAYHLRAKELHPDSGGNEADAEAFKKLLRAYDEVKKIATPQ
eukprot:CAMPEP_0115864960 /NCGR_PEP_ID=MMETSP0287-20121206/19470_1 /TAXON_ID=412157 /ORGANISM="Chrysochromulina rotalis, Strain UIO044" /LENGTH=191 /DNA_ID=CAMNT_0003319447 /DNA_START=22 /DNA_END=597 /DNA_ORIENTATION=-